MTDARFLIFKYNFNYFVAMLIIRNISYLIAVGYTDLSSLPIIFVPLAYLLVKFIYFYDLEKLKIRNSDTFIGVLIGFTIINIVLSMNIVLTFSVVVFLLYLEKKKNLVKLETEKNIEEYFENRQNKNSGKRP